MTRSRRTTVIAGAAGIALTVGATYLVAALDAAASPVVGAVGLTATASAVMLAKPRRP